MTASTPLPPADAIRAALVATRSISGPWEAAGPTTQLALRDAAETGGPILALANTVVRLLDELEAAGLADRTAPYQVGERRAGDGVLPPDKCRHATPREIAEGVLARRLGR